jgi:hypothetical protein
MQFPKWADGPRLTKAERASGRLKYLVLTLATEHTGRASMRSLANAVGLEHSTVSKSITQGSFSEKSALQILHRLKPRLVTVEMLMNPMGIGKSPG